MNNSCSLCYFSNCPEDKAACLADSLWECQGNYCHPKDLAFDKPFDYYLGGIVFFLATYSSIAGIGGGGMIIPLIVLLGNYQPEVAVPMVIAAGFGNGLVRFLYYYPRFIAVPIETETEMKLEGGVIDLETKRMDTILHSAINYNMILLSIPMQVVFVFIGVYLNIVSPSWLILVGIIIIFLITIIMTWRNGIKMRQAELSGNMKKLPAFYKSNPCTLETNIKIGILISIFVINSIMSYYREEEKRCSTTYWWWVAGQFIVLLTITAVIVSGFIKYIATHQDKDIEWDFSMIKMQLILGGLVGIVSPLFGIGGGIIFSPYLVHIKINPLVIIATNSIAIILSTSASLIQYAITNRILYKYSLYLAGLSFIGSGIGLLVNIYLAKKIGKRYIYIFLLVGALGICLIALVIASIEGLLDKETNYYFQPEKFCDS